MKKVVTHLLVFLLPVISFSQQSKIDSLLTLLKKDKEDTSKIVHLNNLSYQYINISEYDSALHYGKIAEQLALQLNFKRGIASSYSNSGHIYYLQGSYSKALEYWLNALKIDEVLKDKNGMAKRLGNIGGVYLSLGNYPKTLDYFFRALKLGEEVGSKVVQASNFNNIGTVYYIQKDYPRALDYFFKALKIDEGIKYNSRYVNNLNNIGLVYAEQGDYPKTLEYYFKALKISEELGDKNAITLVLGNIGSIYVTQKKYKEAEQYIIKSLSVAKEIGTLDGIKEGHQILSKLYEQIGILDKALEHYKQFIVIKDSIFNTENSEKIANAQFKYEQEKKDKIRELEEKVKEQQHLAEVKQQNIIIFSVIGGLLLVVVFAGFIFRSLRVTRKQKHIIELQKDEVSRQKQIVDEQKRIVEEHNKDITDSIHYASRIQRALLTSEEYISKHLNEYFILFKPKDIVSGDFYWAFSPIQSVGKQIFYFACCDCTGHGVPGAFMSLLNISFLNEALIEKELRDTDKILNDVRKNVIKSLNPDGKSDGKDGMDSVFFAIDLKNNILQVSCANNPLWVLQNGEINEIAPDKMPVGLHSNMESFKQNTIQLNKGDIIYAFTDGYADQFGGPKGKKFKYKQLEEVLITNHRLPMNEQKKILDKIFEDWRGNMEQVDDVLIIGIRIT